MCERQALGRRLRVGRTGSGGRFGAPRPASLLASVSLPAIGPVSIATGLARCDLRDERGQESAWHGADSMYPSLERARLAS